MPLEQDHGVIERARREGQDTREGDFETGPVEADIPHQRNGHQDPVLIGPLDPQYGEFTEPGPDVLRAGRRIEVANGQDVTGFLVVIGMFVEGEIAPARRQARFGCLDL